MKNILDKSSIQAWDRYTILNEPIKSIDLMWRASQAFCKIFETFNYHVDRPIHIFCGSGNNGGDGIAIGLILDKAFRNIHIHLLSIGTASKDRIEMAKRLNQASHIPVSTYEENNMPDIHLENNAIVIDAIFGVGINSQIRAPWDSIIDSINKTSNDVVAVDNPSGLLMNVPSVGSVIKADHTITFQSIKLSHIVPENGKYLGKLHVADIGLLKEFEPDHILAKYIEASDIKPLIQARSKFSHKGTFGHACIIGGSYGMMGAVILAAEACLRTGAGKLTLQSPKAGIEILQTSIPEAMVVANGETNMQWHSNLEDFDSLGIGCGLGQDPDSVGPLTQLLNEIKKSIVVDADALNILAANNHVDLLPYECIITPHLKEFDRLFGQHRDQFQRFITARSKAKELNIIIVLKGAYTSIFDNQGNHYVNSTGNPGMATAGSGDVLTGIITGLLAQKYSPVQAAIIGVFLHGMAGDFANNKINEHSIIASDIVAYLSDAYNTLSS